MERWMVVPSDWWEASFRSVFWPSPYHNGASATHSRPGSPPTQDVAAAQRSEAPASQQCPDLHPGLVGVRGVEAVIRPYEADVGIYCPVAAPPDRPPVLDGTLDEESLKRAQRTWEEQVETLLGGVCTPVVPSPLFAVGDSVPSTSKLWDLNTLESPLPKYSLPRTSTPLDLVDLTDSDFSVDSEPLPSTPKASSKKSYAHAVFSEPPPSMSPSSRHLAVLSPLPSKPLNASALSFIPTSTTPISFPRPPATPPSVSSSHSSDSSFPSPTYEFDFPSLNANPTASPSARKPSRPLQATLQKDENGFYHPVGISHASTSRRPTAAFLPAFLADRSSPARTRNTSKTREIVDRLRSSHASNRPRKVDLHARRQSLPAHVDDEQEEHAGGPLPDADGWITGIVHEDAGWAERSASLTPPPAFPSPATSGSSGAPCTPAFCSPPRAPAHPATVHAYMHMQLQMQHAAAQWQVPVYPAGAPGFFPRYGPYGVAPPFAPAQPLGPGPVLYESKGKMGAPGIYV